MSKSVRLSEKWFNRILWGVAIVFAWFLIGLGSNVVHYMPKLNTPVNEEQFMDASKVGAIKSKIDAGDAQLEILKNELSTKALVLQEKRNAYRAASETYQNWLASRTVTQRSSQDPAVLIRVKQLDTLKAREREAQTDVENITQAVLRTTHDVKASRDKLQSMREQVKDKIVDANRTNNLKVFLYRLLFTLPLLVAAGWLFKTRRKSTYWPFVMGFGIFALFVFFVELVPYLPNYGGFVRYIVGIIITVIGGRYAIQALQKYREQQALAEQKPDEKRRSELSYDVALTRLSKCVCPGCERPVDLMNKELDFCNHCGIALHNNCTACNHRKSAFSKFCMKCGASGSTDAST